MPSNIVKSFANRSDKSEQEVENLWNKAKEIANKEGKVSDYAYITGILKKMLKLESTIMSFNEFLNEARRNPEQNPKIGIVQALEPYKDDENIYISFTRLEKIGIKPLSNFNTPNGIYCYPLKEMWDNIVNNKIPFAGDRPYVHVIKAKNKGLYKKDLYKDYTSADVDRDIAKLKKMFERQVYPVRTNEIIEIAFKKANDNSPGGKMWNLFRFFAMIDHLIKKEKMKGSQAVVKARLDLDDSNIKSTQDWNNLMRALGYTYVADKSGRGIIHQSEPTQAVFFSRDAFEVVDMIRNIRPRAELTIFDVIRRIKSDKNVQNQFKILMSKQSVDADDGENWIKFAQKKKLDILTPPLDFFDAVSTSEMKSIFRDAPDEILKKDFPDFLFGRNGYEHIKVFHNPKDVAQAFANAVLKRILDERADLIKRMKGEPEETKETLRKTFIDYLYKHDLKNYPIEKWVDRKDLEYYLRTLF